MKLVHKIHSIFSNLSLRVLTLVVRVPEQKRISVPYVSQFANPAWSEMVLKDNQPISRDLEWEKSGARSIKEYETWVRSLCGMACTVMALHYFKKGEFKTIPLARSAAQAGVYTIKDNNISNLLYYPYVKWIKQFGVSGTVYTKLGYRSICYLLSKNYIVFASVNPNIRDYNTAPKDQVGGHLIVITGYNKKEKTITFHNPSGFENSNTQINHTIQTKVWTIYFAGRGIAIKNKN